MYHLDNNNSLLYHIVNLGLNQVQKGTHAAFSRLLQKIERLLTVNLYFPTTIWKLTGPCNNVSMVVLSTCQLQVATEFYA